MITHFPERFMMVAFLTLQRLRLQEKLQWQAKMLVVGRGGGLSIQN